MSGFYPRGEGLKGGIAAGSVLQGPLPALALADAPQQQSERVQTQPDGLH